MAEAQLESVIGKTIVFQINGNTLTGTLTDILVDLSNPGRPLFYADVSVHEPPGPPRRIPIKEASIVEVR